MKNIYILSDLSLSYFPSGNFRVFWLAGVFKFFIPLNIILNRPNLSSTHSNRFGRRRKAVWNAYGYNEFRIGSLYPRTRQSPTITIIIYSVRQLRPFDFRTLAFNRNTCLKTEAKPMTQQTSLNNNNRPACCFLGRYEIKLCQIIYFPSTEERQHLTHCELDL